MKAGKGKGRVKSNRGDNWLYGRGVKKEGSRYSILLTDDISEMNPNGWKLVAESSLRRGALRIV